ncbi:histidine kinase [Kribbella sp. NPDC005582]|uniref:sensor histidine kinase n=1 Tax=Kribbella sp. NPDC005582 TaxID=3156893 RepID=UPI0033A5F79F
MRIEAWMRSHVLTVDVILAAALLAAATVFGLVVHASGPYFVFSCLLLIPLAVRRRRPVWCLVVIAVAALAQWLSVRGTVGAVPADVAVPLAVHAAAAYGPRWARLVGLLAGLVGAVLGGVEWPRLRDSLVSHLVVGGFLASTVIAAWAVGTMQRVRRSQVEAQRELAVLAERARIAREMHDVVAHSLAVVIAQADGGRYAARSVMGAGGGGVGAASGVVGGDGDGAVVPVVGGDGDGAVVPVVGGDGDGAVVPAAANGVAAAVLALETIGAHARQALGDTRRILGVLRDNPELPVEPAAGLADLPPLVSRVPGATLSVEVDEVEPGVGLAAYRIVQEGLTNVMKHAGPDARAEVTVRSTPGGLEVLVADDGLGPGDGQGFGLLGMRERVAAYGGSVQLTERRAGGTLLRAIIPVAS